jgi:hypothetical protein
MWSFLHVINEGCKTIAPAFTDGNAAPSVIGILSKIPVCASLNHLPPTGVSRSVTFANQRLPTTKFRLGVEMETAARLANRHPPGFPRGRIGFSPYAAAAENLPHHLPTPMRPRLATGAATTRRISAAKISSSNRYLSTTVASASKEGLAFPHLVEAQNRQDAVSVSDFVLESSCQLIRHGLGKEPAKF